jgi:hypothetical protein
LRPAYMHFAEKTVASPFCNREVILCKLYSYLEPSVASSCWASNSDRSHCSRLVRAGRKRGSKLIKSSI